MIFAIDIRPYCKKIEEDGEVVRYQIRPSMTKWCRENLRETMFQGGLFPSITLISEADRDAFLAKYGKCK